MTQVHRTHISRYFISTGILPPWLMVPLSHAHFQLSLKLKNRGRKPMGVVDFDGLQFQWSLKVRACDSCIRRTSGLSPTRCSGYGILLPSSRSQVRFLAADNIFQKGLNSENSHVQHFSKSQFLYVVTHRWVARELCSFETSSRCRKMVPQCVLSPLIFSNDVACTLQESLIQEE